MAKWMQPVMFHIFKSAFVAVVQEELDCRSGITACSEAYFPVCARG